MTDTEALKALVALARKLPKLPFAERDGVQNADFAMATVKALPALERMLASLGEQREAQGMYAKVWLVWSNEHCAYWAPNCMGYVGKVENAGRFSLEEAKKHANSGQMGGKHARCEHLPNEIVTPAPEISAPPLAESVGDVPALALAIQLEVERVYDNIDTSKGWGPQVREAIAAVIRRHMVK